MSAILDPILNEIDLALRTLFPPKLRITPRPSPAEGIEEPSLSLQEKKHVSGLMRVNHAGEVCAQALYQGQSITAKLPGIRQQLQMAAEEETDHLAWCEQRLQDIQGKPSLLNPLWYGGSLFLGALAGLAGDQYSLGFLAETEKQVSLHLQKHLHQLPDKDIKSAAIIKQMHWDESQHAQLAQESGGRALPLPIQYLMQWTSKLMTYTSYYL